ncbi:MAG: sulfotransferase [Desulfobulbus sp.]|nr:sulfotransferase [Desulfobulbus sp.]
MKKNRVRLQRKRFWSTKRQIKVPTPAIQVDAELPPKEKHSQKELTRPYNEHLLERCRIQWQFGDWKSLVKIKREVVQDHPDHGQLALFLSSGYAQLGDIEKSRQFIQLAKEWGCGKLLIGRIIASGVYNSLGRAAALDRQYDRATHHFKSAIAVSVPNGDKLLLSKARISEQLEQLNNTLITNVGHHSITHYGYWNRDSKLHLKKTITVRSIHHLSCTGGTLFAKCIAALPGVVVLNEIDPYSSLGIDKNGKGIFNPTDIIALLHQSFSDIDENLIEEVFLNDIETIAINISKKGRQLVLRDHSHSAYLVGDKIRMQKNLHKLLRLRFDLKSIVTVRNPIDSFLSLRHNNWIHYTPQTFDEYCYRYIHFLQDHHELPIVRYEDFVSNPEKTLKYICSILNISYSTNFIHLFSKFKFSGDSGRSGDIIEPRQRREYDQYFIDEVNSSYNYSKILEILRYPLLR